MKYSVVFFLLLFFISPLVTRAQENVSEEDISGQAKPNEEGLNRIFNANSSPTQTLTHGGAFYVSNPSPLVELDPKLAYYRTEWEPLIIRLVTGETTELTGRYRLLDQKFEIKTDDGIYEIYSTMVAEAQLGDDYFLVQTNFGEPSIHQVYYRGEEYMLLGEHTAVLKDPPSQNMFDTRDAKQTLKRAETVYLRYPDGIKVELKNKKQTLTVLRVYKGSAEAAYVKKHKIDLKVAMDIAKLLTFMNNNDG